MHIQNRPYSVQGVIDNNAGLIPRKICEDVLTKLTTEKFLTLKEYGKAKVYLYNQDKFPETSTEELSTLD
jgi:hypothetical protein